MTVLGCRTGKIVASRADIDWVVITLKRTPERLEQFIENNAHQGLSVEAMEAVDGQKLDREELIRNGLIAPDLQWVAGALGAALSHRQCWLRAVETGQPVGIFEDDVLLRNDFARLAHEMVGSLPSYWDLMQFGLNTDSVLEAELVPGCLVYGDFDRWYPTAAECERFVNSEAPVTPVRLTTSFGACAYVVSPRGAQKLLDYCFPLSWTFRYIRQLNIMLRAKTADALMNSYYGEMAAFISVPPIAMARNDKTVSTVNA
jgi:GR25 family glycosyltransferase involved in LPS biosynthesis